LKSAPRKVPRTASRALQPTPRELGYRMPAEWERHEATWLAWPHERTDWPGKFEPIPWVYADIVRYLARVEGVRILVGSAQERARARRILSKTGADLAAVDFFVVPTNRGWTRDYGPIFIKKCPGSGGVALTNWHFNAWAKYDDWRKDDAATKRLIPNLKLPVWEPVWPSGRESLCGSRLSPLSDRRHSERREESLRISAAQRSTTTSSRRRIVLEGGSIDVNGLGTLLTTEECLLSKVQARNPGCTRADMEAIFRDYLGINHTLWLGNGIAGDDTHGHVDDLARFVNPTTVVTVVESDRADANFAPLQDNLARLRSMKDQDDRPLRVETLPMPEPVWFEGQRLPASYANFYIANALVLVPTFNDANDRIALNTLAGLFPDRKVVGIPCRDLVLGLGTLHCMTQQQPA
jgi:agmatine deiminase